MIGNKCPECGSKDLIQDYERDEIVCGRCGLIIDETELYSNYNLNESDFLQNDKSDVIEDLEAKIGDKINYSNSEKFI